MSSEIIINITDARPEIVANIIDVRPEIVANITASGPRGEKGEKGDQGLQGLQGVPGEKGDPSEMFPATTETLGGVKVGSGLSIAADGTLSVDKSQIHEVPAGGEQNQVMKKMSGTDYDYGWGDSVKIEAYGSTLTIL